MVQLSSKRQKSVVAVFEVLGTIGTLRYGNADALKYATVEESLGREHSVRGRKIKLRFVASDAMSFSSSLIWLLSGSSRTVVSKSSYCCSMRKVGQIIWIFLTRVFDILCWTKMEPRAEKHHITT